MPLAAALLKAQLDSVPEIKGKLTVSLMDYYIDSTAEFISENICNEAPDIIGFSTYLWNRELTEKTCRIIKSKFPDILLFAGGAEATASPRNLLNSSPFDFVIKGEGELVLTEVIKRLLRDKTFNDIPGVFIKSEENDTEESQCPVMDLDSLPSPFLNGVIDTENYPGVLWELSRGCPFKCSFCFESRGVAGVREFSMGRLQEELELFESKKTNQVFILDATFNRNGGRAKKILEMILKTAPLIHFTFEVRAEFIDDEMAELFSMLNCSLQIGLQSAIPEVLTHVNRKLNPDKFAKKIGLLNSTGVVFGLDLIYGLPGDTIEGFKLSLNFALKLQPNHLDIFPLAVLPGTALYDQSDLFSLNHLEDAPYTLISSPGFSDSDMNAAGSLRDACNVFYNQGGAAGWMFMVLETLDIDPSTFLESFGKRLSFTNQVTEFSRDEITVMQLSFVKEQFSAHNKQKLYPVMEDIIKFNGALNNSLYAGPYMEEIKTSFTDETVFKTAAGTEFLSLKYNFNDLMAVGELTLEEFLENFSPEKTSVIIYNYGGEIKPLIVNESLIELVQALTGEYSLKEVLENNSLIEGDDACEFIEYALAETIIYIM